MISVNRLPLRGKRLKRDRTHQNPALLGLKRHAKPLVPMFSPLFGAHISCSEFRYLDLNWKGLCGIMANYVAESGVIKSQ